MTLAVWRQTPPNRELPAPAHCLVNLIDSEGEGGSADEVCKVLQISTGPG